VLALIIALGFARSDDAFVKLVMVGFLFVAINLGLCDMAGKTICDTGSVRSLGDCFRTGFSLGMGKVSYTFRGISIGLQTGSTVAKSGSAVLLGLVIAVPFLAVMIPLLMNADAAFEGMVNLLPEIDVEEIFWSVVFGFGVTCLVCTRAMSLKCLPKQESSYVNLNKGIHHLTVNTVLGCVCGLYGVYLVSQLAYFSGGFAGILPEGYTVAEYARRGFFEMAYLCAINLTVMILAISFTEKREDKTPFSTRVLCLVLGVVTLFLVCTAGAKMVLYISSFGMTRLRVLTMVIMVFFALTTAVVSLWLFVPKLAYMRVVVLGAMILGAAVLWVDVDTVVASYNVDGYLSGKFETVDVAYLHTLGNGAVPALERLVQEAKDGDLAQDAAEELARWAYRDRIEDFRDWNLTQAQAWEILEEYRNLNTPSP
jgi:hypothetical protein